MVELIHTYNDASCLFVSGPRKSHTVGSTTQISGCQDPLETDSSRTKNILSRCMNPSPIFHCSGVNWSMVCDLCGLVLSNPRRAIPPP